MCDIACETRTERKSGNVTVLYSHYHNLDMILAVHRARMLELI